MRCALPRLLFSDPHGKMNSIYQNISDTSSGFQFRLLCLAPAALHDAPIAYSLSTHVLSRTIAYEALSYCWGNAASQKPTICNGVAFMVGNNLEAALRRLRLVDRPRTLWIDAVCINQSNDDERAQQVGHMRDIYSYAKRVLIWLGPKYESSELVFPLCERIARAILNRPEDLDGVKEEWARMSMAESRMRMNENAGQPREEAEDDADLLKLPDSEKPTGITITSHAGIPLAFAHAGEFQALLRLLLRPWWTRSWTIQEICLATEATLFCGDTSIGWHVFAVVILLLFLDPADSQNLPVEIRSQAMSMIRTRSRSQQPQLHGEALGLVGLLQEFRSQDATDKRDKIYAFLGLVPSASPVHALVSADYKIRVEQCYTKAARALLSLSQNLDLLAIDRYPSSGLSSSLPSWVPDWSFPVPRTVALPLHAQDPSLGRHPFSASGRCTAYTPPQTDDPVDPAHLLLSGFVFDGFTSLTAALPPLFEATLDGFLMDERSLPTWRTSTKPFFASVGAYYDVLLEWESFTQSACSIPGSPYGHGPEDFTRVLTALLCAGNLPDGLDAAHEAFMLRRTELKWPRRLSKLAKPMLKKGMGRTLLGMAGMISQGVDYNQNSEHNLDNALFHHIPVATGRRLGRTAKGYLALVPEGTRKGDQIGLFEGAKVPVILREARDTSAAWELVGVGYVHGIMDGEGWNERRCEVITVV